MANPTLKSIEKLLIANHNEMSSRMAAVEEQVRLTNGRVKALETESAVQAGVEKYKATQEQKREWGVMAKIGVLAAIGALVGGLWWVTELIRALSAVSK